MDPELVALLEELRAIAAALKEREAGLGDEVKAAVDAQVKGLREQAVATQERLDAMTAASEDEAASRTEEINRATFTRVGQSIGIGMASSSSTSHASGAFMSLTIRSGYSSAGR